MSWDPATYLRFVGHRERPGIELMARIPLKDASRVLDLGCGTGSLTRTLADRFPGATVVGIDSSPEMLGRARTDHPDLAWIEADLATFTPDEPVDVVFSNAALHWLGGHAILFRRLRSWLRPGGVLAVQMPNNWGEPTHTIPAAILDSEEWPGDARSHLMRDRLALPSEYAAWVQPAEVDLWETTYHQRLDGDDPVLTWVSGSVLRPVLDALEPPWRDRFVERCRAEYDDAYPPDEDGTTTLPFRRMFLVATVR